VISEPLGVKSLSRGRVTGAVVPDFPEVPPSVARSLRLLSRRITPELLAAHRPRPDIDFLRRAR
jgi:hypothetical protein